MRYFFLISLFFLLPSAVAAPFNLHKGSLLLAQQEISQILEFAQLLESQGDYYRAITEYKRVIFFDEQSPLASKAYRGIARCYFAGKKWEALLTAIKDARKQNKWSDKEKKEFVIAKAIALWNLNRPQEALEEISQLQADILTVEEKQLKAWITLAAGHQLKAAEQFEKSNMKSVAQLVREAEPSEKSPFLAGSLSTVLPGAGQLYAGRPQAALGALVVNGLLIAATIEAFDEDLEALGWGLGAVGFGFWMGNIYGAVNFVNSDNKENISKKDEWIAKKMGLNQNFKDTIQWHFTYSF